MSAILSLKKMHLLDVLAGSYAITLLSVLSPRHGLPQCRIVRDAHEPFRPPGVSEIGHAEHRADLRRIASACRLSGRRIVIQRPARRCDCERDAHRLRPQSGRGSDLRVVDRKAATSAQEIVEGVRPYTIVIPPPNVTGSLHMGHALNNTIQDVVIRRQRMTGRPTRWVVGTDHAGIATQNKVEQKLAEEGKSRHDVGREAFIEACWEWRREHGSTIIGQLKAMGCSCDYSDEWFTMDPSYQTAVRKVFVDWFDKGLIYRGKRIINWCPRCSTALSDIEVEHEDVDSHLWHLRYPLKEPVGGVDHVVVATTRPETMLGDTCVAVHPDDERYTALVGATVVLPLMGREIPIVADDYVDPSFGTGAVKVTPAHDPNDFEIGERHDCAKINVMNADATISAEGGAYAGLDRYEARERVIADLEAAGLLVQDRRPRPLGRALLPLPHRHRAVALGPVVRRHEAARRAGDRGGPRRSRDLPPQALGERLLPLDGEHPRLVHLAPAVVGSPHPGLLLRRVRR